MTPITDHTAANAVGSPVPGLKQEPTPHEFRQTNTPIHNGSTNINRKRKGKDSATASTNVNATPSPMLQQSRGIPPTHEPTLSRKRSRSGTRKPNGVAGENDVEGVADETDREMMEYLLEQYTARDELDTTLLQSQAEHRDALLKAMQTEIQMWKEMRAASAPLDPGRVYGEGFKGYGNGWTAQYPTKVIYPLHKRRPGGRRARDPRLSRKDRVVQGEQMEELVPVRLDLETEKLRIRDTFTWNMFDRTVRPEAFAEGLVEDLQVPVEAAQTVTQQVFQALQEQIQDYHPHPFIEEEPLDPHLPYTAYKDDEIRVVIKINITIGQHNLVDQFDWDINNRLNSPEDFAMRMATDLSLSGEFMTAIAHSIREQTQMFTRSLYITGHAFDGRPVEDAELRENLLPSPLPSSFRPFTSVKEFTPFFYELTNAEIEHAEATLSREQRQQKRSVNRRGGPAMPDLKERLRTIRTMVVSRVLPGAAESLEKSYIYKPTRVPSGRGRRPYKTDGVDSDDSDSDDSDPDSPARAPAATSTPLPITGGTARTRGIRGAASAAQAAMRATLAGSMTPETQHELTASRSMGRRGGYEIREGSGNEPPSFMLRLKMPRAKYRIWWRNYKEIVKQRLAAQQVQQAQMEQQQRRTEAMVQHQQQQQQEYQQQHHSRQMSQQQQQPQQQPLLGRRSSSRAATPGGTPAPGGASAMAPPLPSTPGMQSQQYGHQQEHFQQGFSGGGGGGRDRPTHRRAQSSLDGASGSPVGAGNGNDSTTTTTTTHAPPTHPPPTTKPPPPPPWLTTALSALRTEFPQDSFSAMMRWSTAQGVWQPRIKCHDCTGTVYNTNVGDPGGNFRVHLGNVRHRERVERRVAEGRRVKDEV